MNLGPVMLDIAGLTLEDNDRRRLQHPQVGGVILFARNYESPEQLKVLVDDIHSLRMPQLVVAVDQEGGRVQRFPRRFSENTGDGPARRTLRPGFGKSHSVGRNHRLGYGGGVIVLWRRC